MDFDNIIWSWLWIRNGGIESVTIWIVYVGYDMD